MIKKELFIKCLTNLEKYNNWEHKLYKLGINFWERDEIQNLVLSYIELLEYCCKDISVDYSETNISYFIYECEFGKKADEYFITESDGNEVHFNTIEDLWNYLVKCNPDIVDNEEEKTYNNSNNKGLSADELKDIFFENYCK